MAKQLGLPGTEGAPRRAGGNTTGHGGKDKPVVVYCKSGGRAGKAKQALEAAGFTRVVNGGGYRKLAAQ